LILLCEGTGIDGQLDLASKPGFAARFLLVPNRNIECALCKKENAGGIGLHNAGFQFGSDVTEAPCTAFGEPLFTYTKVIFTAISGSPILGGVNNYFKGAAAAKVRYSDAHL
jgi:hypothetical protein